MIRHPDTPDFAQIASLAAAILIAITITGNPLVAIITLTACLVGRKWAGVRARGSLQLPLPQVRPPYSRQDLRDLARSYCMPRCGRVYTLLPSYSLAGDEARRNRIVLTRLLLDGRLAGRKCVQELSDLYGDVDELDRWTDVDCRTLRRLHVELWRTFRELRESAADRAPDCGGTGPR